MTECVDVSNSFVQVIVIKTDNLQSDLQAIERAIKLLKEELEY